VAIPASIRNAVRHPIRTVEAKTVQASNRTRALFSYLIFSVITTGLSVGTFLALPGAFFVGEFAAFILTGLGVGLGVGDMARRSLKLAQSEREGNEQIALKEAEITQLRESAANGGELVEHVAISQRRELQFVRIRQELVLAHIHRLSFILGEKIESNDYWIERMEKLLADSNFVAAHVTHFERILGARNRIVTISVDPKTDLLQRLSVDKTYLDAEMDYIRDYIRDYQAAKDFCAKDKLAYIEEELFYLAERYRVRQEELRDVQLVHDKVMANGLDPSGYEFVRSLGIGGMGVALLFYSVALRQFVVAKVHTGDCTPEALARFEREIKALTSLQHDNVARIYYSGVDKKEDVDLPLEKGGMSPATFVSRALRDVEQRMRADTETQNSERKALDNLTLRLYQKDKNGYDYDFNYYVMELIRGGDLGHEIWSLQGKSLRMSAWRTYSYLWQILSAIECYSKRMVTKNAFLSLGQIGSEWWDLLEQKGAIRSFITRHAEENAVITAEIQTINSVIDAIGEERPEFLAVKGEVKKIFANLPQSIIHRDLKPDNVIPRKERGEVKVLDFGIAKVLRPSSIAGTQATRGLTQVGQLLVTLQYAPLEQLLGSEHIDITVDLYALAAIAYELLTSEMLFSESDYQQSLAARRDEGKIKNKLVKAFMDRMETDGIRVADNIVDQAYFNLSNDFCRMLIRMLAAYPKATKENQQHLDRPSIDEVKAVLEPLMKYAAWKAGRRETPN